MMRRLIGGLVLMGLVSGATAADWAFFRGPNGNGTTDEASWKTWGPAGPKIAWEKEMGIGVSAVVVHGGLAYTMGNVDDTDIVYCLDAKTGEEKWTHRFPAKFEKRMFEGGTASTPTIDDDRVYAFSYDGQLFCLDAEKGSVRWQVNVIEEHGGKLSQWKYAGSPLVVGNMLALDIGGKENSTLVLDKMTGKKIWGRGNDKAGYSTIMPFKQAGVPAFMVFKGKALIAVAARDGKELWRIPWESSYDVNATTPVLLGDKFFMSSGYPKTGRGAMYQMGRGTPRELWVNEDIKTKMNTSAPKDGYLYGITEKKGMVFCLDQKNGKTTWTDRAGTQFGNLILSGDRLVFLTDAGDLVVAAADPKAYKELARARVLNNRCWVTPTLANGFIYCRNNKGRVIAVDVRK